jgi:AmiR/NasT family two-component response regulator
MSEAGDGMAAQPSDSGQVDRRGREAVLARAFVRLADTLASEFDIIDFLQAALTSRVVIEQAKGMLAEYLRMTVDDAFQLLRDYA